MGISKLVCQLQRTERKSLVDIVTTDNRGTVSNWGYYGVEWGNWVLGGSCGRKWVLGPSGMRDSNGMMQGTDNNTHMYEWCLDYGMNWHMCSWCYYALMVNGKIQMR